MKHRLVLLCSLALTQLASAASLHIYPEHIDIPSALGMRDWVKKHGGEKLSR